MLRAMKRNLAMKVAWRVLVFALAAGGCHGSQQDTARAQTASPPTQEAAPAQPGSCDDPNCDAVREQPIQQGAESGTDSPGDDGDIPAPPDVAAPPKDALTSPKGVFYKVLTAGKGGPKPTAEDTVRVHYTGWTTDGKMFDSSVGRGQPNEFPLKFLIPGWTDAIPVMSVGDKVRFWIPEELAYKGQPGRPAGMLVFDVELLAILPPG
jgi:FKBP-type peptidyl-prolyl cis-trans isomerase